ncbi:Selenocysteine lyase [Burkholderia cenocepacia PC184]|nr:Selenocysteine lyase [Burkholderia cenocepacia PC184]
MTIPTPTVNPGLAGGDAHALPHAPLPAGLPDPATLARLASEFFATPPGQATAPGLSAGSGAVGGVPSALPATAPILASVSNPVPGGSPLAGPGGAGTGIPGLALPQGKVPGANLRARQRRRTLLSLRQTVQPPLAPHAAAQKRAARQRRIDRARARAAGRRRGARRAAGECAGTGRRGEGVAVLLHRRFAAGLAGDAAGHHRAVERPRVAGSVRVAGRRRAARAARRAARRAGVACIGRIGRRRAALFHRRLARSRAARPAVSRRSSAVRRERDPPRFPDPARARERQAARLVRQRGDDAQAAGRDRPPRVLLRTRELEHPPRGARTGRPRDGCVRACTGNGAALHRRIVARRDRVRARHDRGDQPDREDVGRAERRRRRRDRRVASRASREHRAVAAACRTEGRETARDSGRRFWAGTARRIPEAAQRSHEDRVGHAGVERARHGRAGEGDRRACASRGREGAGRRCAVDLAHACRRASARCGFLRVLRAQDLRADRDRRGVRQARDPRRHAAVAGWRQHDRGRDVRAHGVPAAAEPLRSRHRQHRGCGGARRGARLREPCRHREHRALRARSARVCDERARAGAGRAARRYRARQGERAVVRAEGL